MEWLLGSVPSAGATQRQLGVFKVDFVGRVRADFVFDFESELGLIFSRNQLKSAFGLTTPHQILISQ